MAGTKHTAPALQLADDLMAMAATIAAATSENGASVIREAAAQLRLLHFASPAAPDLLAAIKVAVQLAEVASDWNLDEVEIDGEMVRTHDLAERFRDVIAKVEASHA